MINTSALSLSIFARLFVLIYKVLLFLKEDITGDNKSETSTAHPGSKLGISKYDHSPDTAHTLV